MQSRYEKYMQFIDGNSSIIPIDYIAGVLGVTYADAACDLQEMASLGYIGYGAYVNYRERTLVLKNFDSASQGGSTYHQSYKKAEPKTEKKTEKTTESAKSGGDTFVPNYSGLPAVYSRGKTALFVFLGFLVLSGNISGIGSHLDNLFWFFRWSDVIGILQNLIFSAVGVGIAAFPFFTKKRSERIGKYISMLAGKKSMSLSRMAEYAMCSVETVRRDLTYMIKKGILGQKAHFSHDKTEILFGYDGTEEKRPAPPKAETDMPVEDRYDAILSEIRRLNSEIADEKVSERIEQIEDVTAKIFALVREQPEKESEIKTFMSYYLPTTLKLLRSYSLFEKQEVKGENIDSTLHDIERILDTLVNGFTRQLDRMFRADALDISTDIEVLESMMEQDGLTGGTAFRTAPDEQSK